ncbi:MAG: CdaR family transcriptional regulator [Clostridium sp.]
MLSKILAQKIVDKMMDIVPYNINIMDKEGIIIGSGEKERIGTFHLKAMEALKSKKPIEVRVEEERVKPGVNIKIEFNNRAIGVIGITGEPKKVRPFGEIVKVAAELLISQEYSLEKYFMKNKLKEDFLYEWLYRKEVYNEEFIERGRELEIYIEDYKEIMVIEYDKKEEKEIKNTLTKLLGEERLIIDVNTNRFIVIYKTKINKEKLVERFNLIIAYLEIQNYLWVTFNTAVSALNTSKKINYKDKILDKDKCRFLSSIEKTVCTEDSKIIINKIKNLGDDELLTFNALIEYNFEKTKVAEKMHIHRNTLGYRINKIEEGLGMSLNDTIDLYRCINAYLYNKINTSINS